MSDLFYLIPTKLLKKKQITKQLTVKIMFLQKAFSAPLYMENVSFACHTCHG